VPRVVVDDDCDVPPVADPVHQALHQWWVPVGEHHDDDRALPHRELPSAAPNRTTTGCVV
jgi:hypothetical protein